jgi:hypothetical protein
MAEQYLTALREAVATARVYITPFDLNIRLNKEEIAPDLSGWEQPEQEGGQPSNP